MQVKSTVMEWLEEWIEKSKHLHMLGWNGGEAGRMVRMLESADQLGKRENQSKKK